MYSELGLVLGGGGFLAHIIFGAFGHLGIQCQIFLRSVFAAVTKLCCPPACKKLDHFSRNRESIQTFTFRASVAHLTIFCQ
jgi:hypothetical protein